MANGMMTPPPGGGGMPPMAGPGAGAAPPMDMGAMMGGMMGGGGAPMTPPDGAPSGPMPEEEPLDFEQSMADLVMSALPELDQNDIKVLRKLTPDVAWVLSKVFGSKAIVALQKGGLPQTGLGAPTGAPGPSAAPAAAPAPMMA